MRKSVSSKPKEFGGAAMEYVIISTCSLVIAAVAATFVTKIVKTKMEKIASQYEVEFDQEAFDKLENL